MGTQKLTAIWRVLTSKSYYLISQKHEDQVFDHVGHVGGDLQNMLLFATSLMQTYDDYLEIIALQAAEHGELHLLEQLQGATNAKIEKETDK